MEVHSITELNLQAAVLAATDPLHGPVVGAMQRALLLLQHGADPRGTIDAMIERDECFFESTDQNSPAYQSAVANEIILIQMLANAGATLSRESYDSARYNCAPCVQTVLRSICAASELGGT